MSFVIVRSVFLLFYMYRRNRRVHGNTKKLISYSCDRVKCIFCILDTLGTLMQYDCRAESFRNYTLFFQSLFSDDVYAPHEANSSRLLLIRDVQCELRKAMQMKMELLHICINPWCVRRELFVASVILTECACSVSNLLSYHLIQLGDKIVSTIHHQYLLHYVVFIYGLRDIFNIILP